MMNNNKDMNGQFDRMKQLMNYGLNESKKQPYTGVEYTKVAADGKLYGIVREGTKFYIKVSSKKDNVLAENFEYIGGFRNRKDHEYTSFASAQKNFDFKLRSLAEAYGNGKNIIVESWNPDKQEELSVESTEKMRKEISRERQIMENAMKIFNRKPQSVISPINEEKECTGGDPFCDKADKEYDVKDNIKGKPEKGGKAEDANDHEKVDLKKTEIKEESDQVLGWNRGNDDYMDKSHGTEIGDSMPFDGPEARNIDDGDKKITKTGEEKQGTIHEEDTSMIYTPDNQNSPKPGVGPIGDDNPFDDEEGRQIDEAIDDLDDEPDLLDGEDGNDEDIDGKWVDDSELDLGGEEAVGDEEMLDNDIDADAELDADGDIEERLSSLEDLINKIADKLGIGTYEDDDLYDEDGFIDDDDAEDDSDTEGDDTEFDLEVDDDSDGEDVEEEGVTDFVSDVAAAPTSVMQKTSGKVLGNAMNTGKPIQGEGVENEEIYESRAYRAMKMREALRRKKLNEEGMEEFKDAGRVPSGNMNKLDDFGKHPAYQKKVMELPPKDLQEFPGYYDMNDDSVRNDMPYGERIGDGAPFDIDPDSIDNAIAESINRLLKKNK